jgi:hypothetical protein
MESWRECRSEVRSVGGRNGRVTAAKAHIANAAGFTRSSGEASAR